MRERGTADNVKVVVVDQRELVVRGVRDMLEVASDIDLVGDTGLGRDVSQVVDATSPDVVVVAEELPDADGMEVSRSLADTAEPSASVIVMVGEDSKHSLARALSTGARGVLPQTAGSESWIAAIRAVSSGEAYVPGPMLRILLDDFIIVPVCQPAEEDVVPELAELTARERQILRALAQGDNNRMIARKLLLSEATVKAHVSRLLSKVHAQDRIHLALFAWRLGMAAEPPGPRT